LQYLAQLSLLPKKGVLFPADRTLEDWSHCQAGDRINQSLFGFLKIDQYKMFLFFKLTNANFLFRNPSNNGPTEAAQPIAEHGDGEAAAGR
jgi:hypothetical protein